MKKISKIAALALALALIPAALLGCRNEKKLLGNFEIPKLGSQNALGLESGEIMVYETFKTDADIADRLESTITETYVKFVQDGELAYDFTESVKTVSTDKQSYFEATQENGETTVSRDGEPVPETEAPDIFKYFRIEYDIADVENIEVLDAGNGLTLYAVTMTGDYASRFDSEADGVVTDCTKVLYNYYVDSSTVTRSVLSEFTSTVKVDGVAQTAVRFIQSTIK